MPSPSTINGDAVITSTDWTNPTNALGVSDANSATSIVVGSPLVLTMGDLGDVGVTTNVEYGVSWTATTAGGRDQTLLVELVDATEATVYSSFSTTTRNTTTLATFNTSFAPAHDQSTVNGYRLRMTPQEGGGMGGALEHFIEYVYATITYNEPSLIPNKNARVHFIGL